MKAEDHGVPVRTATLEVDVAILRDQGELQFSNTDYRTEISENKEVDSIVYTVHASPGVSLAIMLVHVNVVYVCVF